jgi:hypothetical protein
MTAASELVPVPADALRRAAAALCRAARWDEATALLDAAGPASSPVLAVAAADTAVDRDFWHRESSSATDDAVRRAAELLGEAPQAEDAWDLERVRLRREYFEQLFSQARDDGVARNLATRGEALCASAPDEGRLGWARFWRGVVADNLEQRPDLALPCFEEAAAVAERTGDELLASYALRHRAGHAEEAGDLDAARADAARSTALRQRLAFVPGVLAQLLAECELSVAAGDTGSARAIAAVVARWGRELDLRWVEDGAAGLLSEGAT